MAVRYLRSTDGSDADNGTTWALAKASIDSVDGIGSIDTAGDTIWVSQVHNESTAGAVTFTCAGTQASPTKLLCGNDAAEPPTALATTAVITVSNSTAITLTGHFYCYGITFKSAGFLNVASRGATSFQEYESCTFETTNSGSGGYVSCGDNTGNNPSRVHFKNCTFTFGGTTNYGVVVSAETYIDGGSLTGSVTSGMFRLALDRTGGRLIASGVDLSALSSTCPLFNASTAYSGLLVVRNCKLPASWTGGLVSGTISAGQRYEMHNCDSTDTNYRLWIEDSAGSIKHETTVVRTSGASDGTTSLAWKMTTSADAEYPLVRLESPEIVQWSDTTGAKTITVEIVHDSQGAGSGSKFQDDEIWLEVMSLNTSGVPLGTWTSDAKADVLATAANQADSSVTWTTTGLTTPVKQALSVSITTAEKGFIHARIVMAKASKTCYVDPLITVS